MDLMRRAALAAATAALLLSAAGPARADTTVYAELVEQNRVVRRAR